MDGERHVELEAIVLSSVLTGAPLPGTDARIALADVGFATGPDGSVRILDDGPPGHVQAVVDDVMRAGPAATVRLDVVEPASLEVAADPRRGAVRLRAWREGDVVHVAAEVCATPDAGRPTVPLEELVVGFAERDGRWQVVEPPRHLAT